MSRDTVYRECLDRWAGYCDSSIFVVSDQYCRLHGSLEESLETLQTQPLCFWPAVFSVLPHPGVARSRLDADRSEIAFAGGRGWSLINIVTRSMMPRLAALIRVCQIYWALLPGWENRQQMMIMKMVFRINDPDSRLTIGPCHLMAQCHSLIICPRLITHRLRQLA